MNILAGYEIGTGTPVQIPVSHMAITGQTQRSGKTTAMESLVERSGMKAIAFVTKQGESAFQFGHQIDPYFKERADWKFVKELFEQLTGYAQNDKEAAIIRLCDGARSLEQVWDRIKAKLGLDRLPGTVKTKGPRLSARADDMYIRMNAYFQDIMPQLSKIPRSNRLELRRGVNVIDMRGFEHGVQEILIQNAFNWVYEKEENTIFIVPEAWDFLSEEHGSITRTAGREFIRRSAALHNFLWADCQDIRGLDKTILGQMGVWLVGNQREMNEVSRTIKSFVSLPAPPSATDIMTLGIGEFFVLHGTESRKVYVQPIWADAHQCMLYAKDRGAATSRRIPLPKMPAPPPGQRRKQSVTLGNDRDEEKAPQSAVQQTDSTATRTESFDSAHGGAAVGGERRNDSEPHTKKEMEEIRHHIAAQNVRLGTLELCIGQITEALTAITGRIAPTILPAVPQTPAQETENKMAKQTDQNPSVLLSDMKSTITLEEIYRWFKDRVRKDPEMLTLLVSQPEITVKLERPAVEFSQSNLTGRIAKLIVDGFFKEAKTNQEVFREFVRIGVVAKNATKTGATIARETGKLCEMGFLTLEDAGYQSVPGMKIRTVGN